MSTATTVPSFMGANNMWAVKGKIIFLSKILCFSCGKNRFSKPHDKSKTEKTRRTLISKPEQMKTKILSRQNNGITDHYNHTIQASAAL